MNVVLNKSSGDLQIGAPGEQLADALVVELKDDGGNPVPNAIVRFATLVEAKDEVTDSAGRATFLWTLQSSDHLQKVKALIGEHQVEFKALAVEDAEAIPLGNTSLWGADGEANPNSSRLIDFSKAGLSRGDKFPPQESATKNIKVDYGAIGDGVNDDTNAFENAFLNATGVVYVPAGTYKIARQLKRYKQDFILRGAGIDQTILFIPTDLETLKGPALNGSGDSRYSFNDAFIEYFAGASFFASKYVNLANITLSPQRGQKFITVNSNSNLQVGQLVLIAADDSNGDLINSLHGYLTNFSDQNQYSYVNSTEIGHKQMAKITKIQGNQITLDSEILANLPLSTTPRLVSTEGYLTNLGLENMTIKFKSTTYPGHHQEKGQNAVQFRNLKNCWIKNVKFLDTDNGIKLYDSHNCSIKNTVFDSLAQPQKRAGHHALWVDWSSTYNHFYDFKINHSFFVHDITIGNLTAANVFERGVATNLTLDNHGGAGHSNLFTNINAGVGSRFWVSGGIAELTPQNGMHNVYWNIRSTVKIPTTSIPSNINNGYFIDLTTFIGVNTNDPNRINSAVGSWIESFTNEPEPKSLMRGQQYMRFRTED